MPRQKNDNYHHIPFVRAKDDDISPANLSKKRKIALGENPPSSGSAVKSFYEEIVGLTTFDDGISESKPKCAASISIESRSNNDNIKQGNEYKDQPCSSSSGNVCNASLSGTTKAKSSRNYPDVRLNNAFLTAAQNGNLKLIKNYIHEDIDIDLQDSYGWTALMCASEAGHLSVVQYLLKCGANSHLSDKRGVTALGLAKAKKCYNITDLLEGKEASSFTETKEEQDSEILYCDLCKCEINASSLKSHETSTTHLFNCKKHPSGTMFMIPRSNRGYQMMLRSGWNCNKGLGPEGQGKKFPVKTVLKQDRTGLGAKKDTENKAKVTHFKPNDTEAIKTNSELTSFGHMRTATLNKRKRLHKERKDRRMEKNFRLQFHME